MHSVDTFAIEAGTETLAADRISANGKTQCLFLHGAGSSSRARWLHLRLALAKQGVGSVAIDFSGHGDSSARTPGSLAKRYSEACHALGYVDADEPRVVVGVSMSGEIAVRLAVQASHRISGLVTIVGAAYDPAAFDVAFGPRFTEILRNHESWRRSEIFSAIQSFAGRVTVIQASEDDVVPAAIGGDLVRNAVHAEHVEQLVLTGVGHAVSGVLDSNVGLIDDVASAIARAAHTSAEPAVLAPRQACRNVAAIETPE
ncbi:alpha/beta fold hydrolase [Cupriavidus sp. HMR-1]|uniref:alpha/beta fold hydrolase n=1 Tax=Cupriavidus sp. HMR-1 TaxID=1249621 RepID=UPI0009DA7688|nr:alpha/beta fold hydrolase [Cupriavidus sp. HMR-1]